MKGLDLIKGMGYIDDDLAAEALEAESLGETSAEGAGQKNASRRRRGGLLGGWSAARRWATAAACLALVCLAGLGVYRGLSPDLAKDAAPQTPMEAPLLTGSNGSAEAAKDSDILYTAEAEESAEMEAEPAENGEMDEAAPAPLPTLVGTAMNDREGEAAPEAEEPAAAYGEIAETGDEEKLTMVSGMAGDYSSAAYAVPENGETGYSLPLADAMAKYGSDALYRVAADVFRNGERLAPDDPQIAELLAALYRDHGIVTAVETAETADGSRKVFNTIHATYEQLEHFPKDEAHGWMLFLYDEVAP